MGVDDVVDGFTMMLLYVCYGVYVGIGFLAMVIGGIYWGSVKSPSSYNPGAIMCMGGLIMVAIGLFAVYAIKIKSWQFMAIVELVNLVVLVSTIAGGIIAIAWATNTSDPVERAFAETWTKPAGRDAMEAVGASNPCRLIVKPSSCTTFYAKITGLKAACDTAVAASAASNPSQAVKDKAASAVQCIEAISTWTLGVKKAGSANCTQVHYTGTATAQPCIAVDSTANQLYNQCERCDEVCKIDSVNKVRDNLKPAAKMFLILFVWIFFTVLLNNFIVHHTANISEEDAEEGMDDKIALVGMGMNGLLTLFSILVIALGIAGIQQSTADCGTDKADCVSVAAGAGVAFGFLIFFVSLVAILSIYINKKGVNGLFKLILRVCQLVYVCLGFVFLICTIVTAIAAGVIDEVNEGMADNMASFLKEAKAAHPDYCTKPNQVVNGKVITTGLTDFECEQKGRAELKKKTEDSMQTVGIVMLAIVAFQCVAVYFSERAVISFRNGGDDDDDGGDDEEET